jgi:5-methyltetrahydrofolate--homocysteine methyltransferase
MSRPRYLDALRDRVLVFDGAMGTSIQDYDLTAGDFGGEHLEGCNDHLVLTRPDVIREIHASFLEAGCDVLETDTFRANRLAIAEYGLEDQVLEMNRVAASLAREVADRFSTPEKPRFVAGSIGPSGFLPSTSDPELGKMSYEELVEVYAEQARGLIEGGVDVLLIETSQDILEVKAAVTGCRRALEEAGADLPLQVQVTLDTSGRMLLGTDIASSMVTLEALGADILGLNCSTGPEHMREPIRYLSAHASTPISVIPNAGIPHNEGGEAVYPLTPAELAEAHREFVEEMGVAIVGGCCGTTPEHMATVVEVLGSAGRAPTIRDREGEEATGGSTDGAAGDAMVPRASSAIRATDLKQIPAPTLIGERVNTQGSRKIKRLLLEDDYDGILQVAREQVEGGAHLLDVCVALTERGGEADTMRTLVKLLSQGVDAPLVIDTTEVDVAIAALRQIPGKAVLNSIHLEAGREKLDQLMPHLLEHGAAAIALTIDEEGMAKSADRKVEVARAIHDIAVGEYGMDPGDLIFDDLTFTLATGDEEFRTSAVATLDGIRRIKEELPGVLTSLGVSNVSFGLQPRARAVLNSVFLHHCVEAGLDMAIVNPAHITPYAEIDGDEREMADDLIFDRREDALPRFIQHFEDAPEVKAEGAADPTEGMTPAEAVHWMILHRKKEGVEDRVEAAIAGRAESVGEAMDEAAVWTLNNVLLPAMKEVGDKFGAGELILPFVLQSAEVMKRAVARLEEFLDRIEGQSKGTVVLATVFGDVHDIGKNLVHTILENNGYTVHNLGKQVPVNTIIEKAEELGADAIGLSALLVSTSKQMPLCVKELHHRGLDYPVLVGGAAINPSFVRNSSFVDEEAGKLYGSGMFYCKDAFDGLAAMDVLVDPVRAPAYLEEWKTSTREGIEKREALERKAAEAPRVSTRPAPSREVDIPEPPFWGVKVIERIPLDELFPLMDLNTLYRLHWGAKNAKGEAYEALIRDEFEPRLARYVQEARTGGWLRARAAYGYFPAGADSDALVLTDADGAERTRFPFPRQSGREELCLSDYFRPLESADDNPAPDVAALQIVTLGDELLDRSEGMMTGGDYSEGYYLHGFGVRLAEAGAEWLHRRIRSELGLPENRGLRYSWGYGACPDHRQHNQVFELLPAREKLGMDLTEAGALVPELSTAALVVHHPEARYFSV